MVFLDQFVNADQRRFRSTGHWRQRSGPPRVLPFCPSRNIPESHGVPLARFQAPWRRSSRHTLRPMCPAPAGLAKSFPHLEAGPLWVQSSAFRSANGFTTWPVRMCWLNLPVSPFPHTACRTRVTTPCIETRCSLLSYRPASNVHPSASDFKLQLIFHCQVLARAMEGPVLPLRRIPNLAGGACIALYVCVPAVALRPLASTGLGIQSIPGSDDPPDNRISITTTAGLRVVPSDLAGPDCCGRRRGEDVPLEPQSFAPGSERGKHRRHNPEAKSETSLESSFISSTSNPLEEIICVLQ